MALIYAFSFIHIFDIYVDSAYWVECPMVSSKNFDNTLTPPPPPIWQLVLAIARDAVLGHGRNLGDTRDLDT